MFNVFFSFVFRVNLSDVGSEPKLEAKFGENRPYGHALQNYGMFVSIQWISMSNLIHKIMYTDVIFVLARRKSQNNIVLYFSFFLTPVDV
jgi:hypothetical protein